ncbi:MAG TPA: ATP-dependent DNA helicase RecG [Candidatus Paceibacterota bacterium]
MNSNTPLTDIFRLTAQQKAALKKLGIATVRDLLWHFPTRYDEGGNEANVSSLTLGSDVTIIGVLEKLETKKSWKRRVPISEGYVRDQTGRIKCMWFNQPYIAKMWADGTMVKATGKVSGSEGKLYLANPQLQKASASEGGLFVNQELRITNYESELFPVYPESAGITSLWMRHAIAKILAGGVLDSITDPLPPAIVSKLHLPSLHDSLLYIHTPRTHKDAVAARKRFAFEEVFFIQLERQRTRAQQAHEQSFLINTPREEVDDFIDTFGFPLTDAQARAIDTILADMQKGLPAQAGAPMSRLLEGDVGSGKTAVAASAAFAVVSQRPEGQKAGALQVAYMAPTEILAKQHFESFIHLFDDHPMPIGLITGSGCYKFPSKVSRDKATKISRAQLLKWVANGEIGILIGTHALIQDAVQFKHLALVIIDEQHRFGTNQRRKLARKETRLPHLLSMTATPIPRTLALTVYGDLDLTVLDEMPAGRKPIITEVVDTKNREKAYGRMRTELDAGRQAYVICPRIDEPDPEKAFAIQAKSVKEEAKRLKKDVFPDREIDILHSKMTPAEKDEVMRRFALHEIDILVATSVVEVGVNVPNATVMFIEGAERFGLAQLHQLRGRIVRSSHQAYCFVLAESRGEHTRARLKALVTAKNGFELAELDLRERGAGELGGGKQWGISDIGMEALENLKLVEAARAEAALLIQRDETLSSHPALAAALSMRAAHFHFE